MVNRITSIAEIRDLIGEVKYTQDTKCIDHIDDHCRAWIERSPFLILSTYSLSGQIDVAPKGDPLGAWQVLDQNTIAIPDRPGNNRADTFQNILENPRAGLLFMVPNRREVVRVSGGASLTRDPSLMETMTVNGKTPSLAIIVHVEEAMFHCGKAVVRSNLWSPERWGPVDGLPTYGEALVDHGKLSIAVDELDEGLREHEATTLY
ncbi:MAG: pyridoxamine 5'-phosphate oxidase family protein [Gammaproteobacteria bacterium]|jgi:PPOX class probable FMN-dependent enzyme|nr:pyridoxamine 5'-phosphate oxidase family protein [Gammaproteobacteria bacterium]MBT6583795.1 pyridoxamine 5'-phosphate oxidase family protein [Gammaproteobacteria bacterium]